MTSAWVCFADKSGAYITAAVGSILSISKQQQQELGSMAFVTAGPHQDVHALGAPHSLVYTAFFPYAASDLQLPRMPEAAGAEVAFIHVEVAT